MEPSCCRTSWLKFGRIGEKLLGRDFFVAFGDAEDEAVVGPHRLNIESAFGAKLRADGHAPRGVNAAAERSEDADAAVAEFVAAGFDDYVLIVGDTGGGDGLIWSSRYRRRFSAALVARLWVVTSEVNATGRG